MDIYYRWWKIEGIIRSKGEAKHKQERLASREEHKCVVASVL